MGIDFLRMSIKDIEVKLKNCSHKEREQILRFLTEDKRVAVQALRKKWENRLRKEIEYKEKSLALFQFDYICREGTDCLLAGVDEVGRGPLAGPIVAAAVILPPDVQIIGANDSKKLSPEVRQNLFMEIKKKAVAWSVAALPPQSIDEIGIQNANQLVMKRAVQKLPVKPDIVLSDGYPINDCPVINKFVIGGDSKSLSIACASIIAKVIRDQIMIMYGQKVNPVYGFERNMGYGTREHLEAIKRFGASTFHRQTFLKGILR